MPTPASTKPALDPGDVGHLVHRLARALRRALEAEIAPLALTGAQVAVLLTLSSTDEPCAMGHVADRLGMDRPTLSGVVRRLERRDWLIVEPNPLDGRSRLLRLSPLGRGQSAALEDASRRIGEAALSSLPARERRRFLTDLGVLLQALDGDRSEEGLS